MSRVTQNPTEPPPVSSMIDNIEMVREIGRGGFGCVFLVKDEAGIYYALKKIPHDKSEHYGKELSALKLYHKIKDKIPNLIPILDIKINNLEISYISGIHKSAAINTVSVGKTKIISTELTKNHAETGVKKPKARNSGSRKNRDLENSQV